MWNENNAEQVTFQGYYGHKNYGDDLFCIISKWGARKYWNVSCPTYIARRLPEMAGEYRKTFPDNQRYGGQYRLKLITHLLKVQSIVFAGGSIFHGEEGWERRYVYRFQKVRRFRMGAIGVSLGPYKTSRHQRQVNEVLKRLSFLVLRDKQSYEEAMSYNLPYQPQLSFDLAGLLYAIYDDYAGSKPNPPILGIIPCNNGTVSEKVDNSLADVALKFSSQGVRIRLICMNSGYENDMKRVLKIAERLPGNTYDIVRYDRNPEVIWKAIVECRAICSIRLHGGITACMGQVPFVQVEYHKKCGDFLDTVDWPEEYRLPTVVFSSSELSDRIERALRFSGPYPVDTATLTELAAKNFTAIRNPK